MAEASGALRRRGSLSARPRSEVPTLSAEIRVPVENDSDKVGDCICLGPRTKTTTD
jgi:hypothetical protein